MKRRTAALYSRVTSSFKPREHRSDLTNRDHQAPSTEVERTSELSPCKLCNEHLWRRGLDVSAEDWLSKRGHWDDEARVTYEKLTVSAAQGCEACALLCTVFQPYISGSVKTISIQSNTTIKHPSSFIIWRWVPEYDWWDEQDKLIGKQTHVRLFTTESKTSLVRLFSDNS
jgi:hypothetical protein